MFNANNQNSFQFTQMLSDSLLMFEVAANGLLVETSSVRKKHYH
jgi:hypothetical protein